MSQIAYQQVGHCSVLKNQISHFAVQALTAETDWAVDTTFGAGGYSRAVLEQTPASIIAIDQDKDVMGFVSLMQNDWSNRFRFMHTDYAHALHALLTQNEPRPIRFIMFDLGVSSMQLDVAERGFSFLRDGPLDMRMSGELQTESGRDASWLVQHAAEEELADIIYYYGDERHSRSIARRIVQARQEMPITRTSQLAELVRRVVPSRRHDAIDPATKTFQAIRIWVNDELGQLEQGISNAWELLAPGGMLAVVSFHSLEDGLVKRFFQNRSGKGNNHLAMTQSRYAPLTKPVGVGADQELVSIDLEVLTKKPIIAEEQELRANPRSRSAKLRVARKILSTELL
jgi:16S rRNA (cytosine1402-N4)-methyltransferase